MPWHSLSLGSVLLLWCIARAIPCFLQLVSAWKSGVTALCQASMQGACCLGLGQTWLVTSCMLEEAALQCTLRVPVLRSVAILALLYKGIGP